MLAEDLVKQFVKEEKQKEVAVIGIKKGNWWHIHREEELPEDNEVAILITEMEWK